jgi:hypothetical protein
MPPPLTAVIKTNRGNVITTPNFPLLAGEGTTLADWNSGLWTQLIWTELTLDIYYLDAPSTNSGHKNQPG